MTETKETTVTAQTQSQTLELPDVDLTYDVRGPIPTADGRPLLLMIGQPMTASGFTTLAGFFPDRTVVTYDPRGLGRSTRSDGRLAEWLLGHRADDRGSGATAGAGPAPADVQSELLIHRLTRSR